MTGGGAARYPGRWNDANEPIVYCAPTIAMAVLETAAHVDDAALPLNRFLVQIEVPDAVWALREELDIRKLPPAWSAIPAGRGSVQIGSRWLSSRRTPILLAPSVIVPEEWCALINPKHAQAAKITAKVVRAFEYNRLFRIQ
jgi:RES domain-containing protein